MRFLIFALTSFFILQNAYAIEHNPLIRIGIIQHFGKNSSSKLKIQPSDPYSRLELIFPRYPHTQDLNSFQKQLVPSLEITSTYHPLKELQTQPSKVIAGTYRTFETASYYSQVLKNKLPELNWQVVYPDPWQVWATSQNPEETVRILKSNGFESAWIQESNLQKKVLGWEGDNLIGEKLPEQENSRKGSFKFHRSKLLVRNPSGLPIKVNGKTYPGSLEIIPDSFGNFSVVNEVRLEDYLRGVVPYEVGADAPQSALETQAILARTYTLANLHRFLPENYQLCATQHCQVYEGLGAINPLIDRAIQNTRGIVLTNQAGQIAQVFYYSTDGGFTANYTDIWPSINEASVKQLDGVSTCSNLPKGFNLSNEDDLRVFLTSPEAKTWGCYDSVSPSFRWEKRIAKSELTQVMKKARDKWKFAWPEFNNIKNVQIINRNQTGRAIKMLVESDKGIFYVDLDEIRTALGGLRSSMFVILRENANGTETLVIKGAGFGHGVGLSQFGARNLASKGLQHRQILGIYFPSYRLTQI
ncbi:MAG: SpoIID/LytB domain-containing protein [Candidatus Caenarcaniphilales bacterium]|nr:SpoIID/LytB domain-containing protein [Candidatus Caenarcaniphilales bacterium]